MEPGIGQPMRRGPAAARVSTRARGATLSRDRQPTRCAGQPADRPGSAAPTSVGAVARPAARPSGASPQRLRGKGRTLEREGARASATRSGGGWKPQRGRLWHRRGEQGSGNRPCELSPRLGPARTGPERRMKFTRGRRALPLFSACSARAMSLDREDRRHQPETAKASGSGEPRSHYRFRQGGHSRGPTAPMLPRPLKDGPPRRCARCGKPRSEQPAECLPAVVPIGFLRVG